MLNGIKEYVLKKITNTRIKELNDYIFLLEMMNDEELGLLLAFATHFRHHFYHLHRINLLDPIDAVQQDIGIILKLNVFYRQARKMPEALHVVPSIVLWIHTLRGAEDTQLYVYIKKIWDIMQKGCAYVPEVRNTLANTFEINITDYEKFPILSPDKFC